MGPIFKLRTWMQNKLDGSRPPVSVVVITRDRREIVLATIANLLEQTNDLEIIVVDNGSTDGTAGALTERYPEITVVSRDDPSPTAGRNAGYELATNDLIVSLDDDIEFWAPSAISELVVLAHAYPEVGAFAFRITDPTDKDLDLAEHWWHGPSIARSANRYFLTDYFPEGAVMFRRELIDLLGGYDVSTFRGGENVELSLRMIGQGFPTLYCPSIRVGEKVQRGMHHKAPRQINYLSLRNRLWAARLHLPWPNAVWFSTSRVGSSFVRAARNGWLGHWWQGVSEGLRPPTEIKNRRLPLSPEAMRLRRRLRKGIQVP
jgi:GT2 family glycosyltransferase